MAKTLTLVERLKAIDEEAMYHMPASTHATIAEAISLLEAAEKALEPFARELEERRDAYIRRYPRHPAVGAENFDKMPDKWPMEQSIFSMGDLRLARSVRDKIKGEAS